MAQRLAGATLDVPEDLSPTGTLTSVDVYISAQCNRRCSYCFLPADFFTSGMRMSLDRFSGVVNWSRACGVEEVTLLGGEPSLHPSFAGMVALVNDHGMKVRVVTNGSGRFRRLLDDGTIDPLHLGRVAVSLDSIDRALQDRLRGPRAWQDAMDTIALLRQCKVPFDINVTAVRPVLDGVAALIDFADGAGCRRVNIHWPSAMGIGSALGADQIPDRYQWQQLTRRIGVRVESRPGFFVEIERGFLAPDEPLTKCALLDFSNLQILPDGRAYRCGLLVDRAEMASLSMTGDRLRRTRPANGEESLLDAVPSSCGGCPALRPADRRACIYDKVSSAQACQ